MHVTVAKHEPALTISHRHSVFNVFRKRATKRNEMQTLQMQGDSSSPTSVTTAYKHEQEHAIAHLWDETGRARSQFPVSIYTASGQQIGRFQWKHGELQHMFWSCNEELFCVQNDGKIFVHSMFGVEDRSRQFSMGAKALELKTIECQHFDSAGGTGVAVLTTAYHVFAHNNVNNPSLWQTHDLPRRAEHPSCWTVFTRNSETRVLYVVGAEIYVIAKGRQPQLVVPVVNTPVKQYVKVHVSYDQNKIALLSENFLVQILSSDMKQCYCECNSFQRSAPEQFLWCGSDSLVMYDRESISLVGLDGGTLRFSFDEPVFCQTEPDGIRIYAQSFHEFLGKVPDAVRAVYQVASNAPGALLLEAYNKYTQGSYQAYDYLRMIDESLEHAVTQCTEAAGNELGSESQKVLLGAASFGKTFAHDMDAYDFVHMCRVVRILNALRHRHFGLPITYAQLKVLSMPSLIDRIIARSQWPLAMKVCEHLKLAADEGVNRVLAHWASHKIEDQQNKSGDMRTDSRQLADVICQKFREYPGVPFADISAKAAECGLKELATMLLEHEPQLVRQVNMLLKLDKSQLALSKATESGDPDLIYFVILHLKKTNERGDLILTLRKYPAALALYKEYCREDQPEHLKALCKQQDDFVAQAICHLQDSTTASLFDVREKQDFLRKAEQSFTSAKEDFYAQQLNDQIKMLKYQAEFEEKYGQPLVDLSLRETVIWLIEKGENQKAEMLKKELRVSEKQYLWWKVEALAKAGRWTELEILSKSKKPPIGMTAFAELCHKYGEDNEALKYFPRMSPDERLNGYLKMGKLEEAATLSFEQGDEVALNKVLSRCGPQHRAVKEKISTMQHDLAASGRKK